MRIVFATNNLGKIREAEYVLGKYGLEIEPCGLELFEATEGTVEEIAEAKLRQAMKLGYQRVMVEDSGISLAAYPSFPGVLSKRVFKGIGYRGLEKLLHKESRRAWFEGAVAICWEGEMQIFSADMQGRLIDPFPISPQAEPGLPFDPLFIVDGEETVFQQLNQEKRWEYSYRRKTLMQMLNWLKKKKKFS